MVPKSFVSFPHLKYLEYSHCPIISALLGFKFCRTKEYFSTSFQNIYKCSFITFGSINKSKSPVYLFQNLTGVIFLVVDKVFVDSEASVMTLSILRSDNSVRRSRIVYMY